MQNYVGAEISKHPVKMSHTMMQYILVVVIFATSIVAFFGMNQNMDSEIMEEMPFYFQYLPFVPAVLAVGLLIKTVTEQSKRVILYSNGIGDGKNVWSWQDVMYYQGRRIQHYYIIIPVGKSYYFRLVFKDGGGLTLDNKYSNIKDLFEHVEDETAKLDIKLPY